MIWVLIIIGHFSNMEMGAYICLVPILMGAYYHDLTILHSSLYARLSLHLYLPCADSHDRMPRFCHSPPLHSLSPPPSLPFVHHHNDDVHQMRPHSQYNEKVFSTDHPIDTSQPPRKSSSLFPLADEGMEHKWDTHSSKSTHYHHSFDIAEVPAHALGEKRPPLLDTPPPVPRPEIITVPAEKILDSPGRHDRPSHVSMILVTYHSDNV